MGKKIKYEEYRNYGKFIGGRMSGKSYFDDDELSPLEKLNRLYAQYYDTDLDEDTAHEYFKDIETALKENEELKRKNKNLILENRLLNQIDKKNEPKLKALEIIKEKRVNVGDFVFYQSINTVDDIVLPQETIFDLCSGGCKNGHLTQEEYDLLKEVLM